MNYLRGLAAGAAATILAVLVAVQSSAQRPADAGERIATGAGPGGRSAACVACHGAFGLGEPGAGIPRLAGLDARYLAKQLDDYASGTRSSAVMRPIAEALDAAQRATVARYYAEKPVRLAAAARLYERTRDADLLQLGATIWSRGSAEHKVQACLTCHVIRRGVASASIYPALAAQPELYLAEQLRQFRDGRRRNDIAGSMRAVAAGLGDREIEALAAYLASLPP